MSSSAADPEVVRTLAQSADPGELEYFVRCVSDLLTRLTRTAIKRTDGEMCLLKMALRHGYGSAPAGNIPVTATTAPMPAVTAAPTATRTVTPTPSASPTTPAEPTETAQPAQAAAAPQPAPVRTASAAVEGDPNVRSAFMAVAGPKVNGAVRTYLNLAEMSVENNILDIACREESMIFMNKPAVQQLLLEAALTCGYQSVRLHKQGTAAPAPIQPAPAEPEAPAPGASALEQVLANARRLGVEIREKH